MEKSFSNINIQWSTLIFILFINCNKSKPKTIINDDYINGYSSTINDSDSISLNEIDSLFMQYSVLQKEIKSSKTRNGFLIVKFYSSKDLYHFVVMDRNTPYSLQNNYKIHDYGSIKLIIESNTPLLKQPLNDRVLKQLIKKGLITLDITNTQEDVYFFEYVTCKKDSTKFAIFDNGMVEDSFLVFKEKNRFYKDSIFYPICD